MILRSIKNWDRLYLPPKWCELPVLMCGVSGDDAAAAALLLIEPFPGYASLPSCLDSARRTRACPPSRA